MENFKNCVKNKLQTLQLNYRVNTTNFYAIENLLIEFLFQFFLLLVLSWARLVVCKLTSLACFKPDFLVTLIDDSTPVCTFKIEANCFCATGFGLSGLRGCCCYWCCLFWLVGELTGSVMKTDWVDYFRFNFTSAWLLIILESNVSFFELSGDAFERPPDICNVALFWIFFGFSMRGLIPDFCLTAAAVSLSTF